MTWTIAAGMITRGTVFAGVVNGLVFGLLAMGIVLIYRSTKVINFAVGNMALGPADDGGYYLVDPHGNLVMYFGPDIDPRDMVDDIKRLLKLSRIG